MEFYSRSRWEGKPHCTVRMELPDPRRLHRGRDLIPPPPGDLPRSLLWSVLGFHSPEALCKDPSSSFFPVQFPAMSACACLWPTSLLCTLAD